MQRISRFFTVVRAYIFFLSLFLFLCVLVSRGLITILLHYYVIILSKVKEGISKIGQPPPAQRVSALR